MLNIVISGISMTLLPRTGYMQPSTVRTPCPEMYLLTHFLQVKHLSSPPTIIWIHLSLEECQKYKQSNKQTKKHIKLQNLKSPIAQM